MINLELNCTVEYIDSFLSTSDAIALYKYLLTYQKLTTKFSMELSNGERFQENYGKMMFIDDHLFAENKFPVSIWGHNQVWSETMKAVKKTC
ncbi:hypothetical protein [Polaribacter sp.]|uniref:hypothetical protein n=1 Tax=Polaribacter sp. TaxID=1920175 RepID=UPI003EFABD22